MDWRELGGVTGVQDQGSSDCCWAFSTAATMEGAYFREYGARVSLSVQQLWDNVETGRMEAFEWIMRNGGLQSSDTYPFVGVKCEPRPTLPHVWRATVREVCAVEPNERALKIAVSRQPVSVSLKIYAPHFRSYTTGVYKGPGDDIEVEENEYSFHAVTVVGYGKCNDRQRTKYWLIKNSYGTDWGVEGYMYLLRGGPGDYGTCNVAKTPIYPIV